MNRTFPALVLKVEYGGFMPESKVPTGTCLRTAWRYPRSLSQAKNMRRELLFVNRERIMCGEWNRLIKRITLCTVQKDGNNRKLFVWTVGEDMHTFPQHIYVPIEVRRASVAIIPAEVVDEATRQKAL